MEALNNRWEELGAKEVQLKAYIRKFEQFIQVLVPCEALVTIPKPATLSFLIIQASLKALTNMS